VALVRSVPSAFADQQKGRYVLPLALSKRTTAKDLKPSTSQYQYISLGFAPSPASTLGEAAPRAEDRHNDFVVTTGVMPVASVTTGGAFFLLIEGKGVAISHDCTHNISASLRAASLAQTKQVCGQDRITTTVTGGEVAQTPARWRQSPPWLSGFRSAAGWVERDVLADALTARQPRKQQGQIACTAASLIALKFRLCGRAFEACRFVPIPSLRNMSHSLPFRRGATHPAKFKSSMLTRYGDRSFGRLVVGGEFLRRRVRPTPAAFAACSTESASVICSDMIQSPLLASSWTRMEHNWISGLGNTTG
jgi:hypothetical protein